MQDAQQQKRQTYGPYICISPIEDHTNEAIHLAMHKDNGKRVWLRVMYVTRPDAADILQECVAQLKHINSLDLPCVIQTDGYGIDGDALYIGTPILGGGTLQMRLERYHQQQAGYETLPSFDELLGFIDRMATALDTIHTHKLVHGQVDPRSIQFDKDGAAWLTDVGLSRMIKLIYGLEVTNSFSMSRYSAPELWDGQRPEPASDLYAVACIVYELLTGIAPFQADTIYQLMQKHLNEPIMPPHYVRKSLSQSFALPFWQALAKPSNKRHKNVREFYEDFVDAAPMQDEPASGFFVRPLS